MEDSRQNEIEMMIVKLRTLWLKYPSLRLGQLIMNIPFMAGAKKPVEIFYCQDDLWEEFIDHAINWTPLNHEDLDVESDF